MVNKSRYWATSLAVLALLSFVPAEAVAQGAGGSPVAVVDLPRIFENHLRYKAQMEEIQRDMKIADDELKRVQNEGRKLFEELEGTNRGTEKYKELDEEIAKREADFKLQVGIQKRNFAEREAKTMFAAYNDVQRRIADYAYKNGFVLVIQFNGMPLDVNEPRTVQQAFASAVQYYDRSIDITEAIVRLCNNDVEQPRHSKNPISRRPPIPGRPPRPGSEPGVPLRANRNVPDQSDHH